MTPCREWLINYEKFDKPVMVMIGDSTRLEGVETGDVELEEFDGTEWCQVVIKNVLHIPKMTFNLFSVTQMFDKGYVQQTVSNESVFKTLGWKYYCGNCET